MTGRRRAGFLASVSDPDVDDFVFEPSEWDIAFEMRLALEPGDDLPALREVADALLVWADEAAVDELAAQAMDAVWSDELEAAIRDGLARVAAFGDEWPAAVEGATAAFDRDPRGSPVTLAVVEHLAMQVGSRDQPHPLFCLCCIDEAVAAAPPEERRGLALEVATLACRDANVPAEEVSSALAACTPSALATDERRRAVRTRLGRLAGLGARSVPALAAQLEAIAVEPLPDDPAADDVWEVVVRTLLARVARPELN